MNLWTFAFGSPPLSQPRRLGFEPLEDRRTMSAGPWLTPGNSVSLKELNINASTGEKPQSKVWQYDGNWFAVLPDPSGTWVRRLDGNAWTPVLRLTTENRIQADVKAVGNLAHVLLFDGQQSQLATIEYVAGPQATWRAWSVRPELVDIALSAGVETATIDLDGAGRLWLASDAATSIEVRHADYPYVAFSPPLTIAAGISTDDICAVAALPDGDVGVLWSDQVRKQFGFRYHVAADEPEAWSQPERPAAQSEKNIGHGMADDHLHLAVAADGTLYAAVKTSYDKGGETTIGLLVRRPNGLWDPLYSVDVKGTRPIVVLNERAGRLAVIYTQAVNGGDIVFRESPLGTIKFGPRKTLLVGKLNDVSCAKQNLDQELVAIATKGKKAVGVRLTGSGESAPISAPPPTTQTDGAQKASASASNQATLRNGATAGSVLSFGSSTAGGRR